MITNKFNQAYRSVLGALNTTIEEDVTGDIKKYPNLLQYFADRSQNRDIKKYDNNPAFKQQLSQAVQAGVVQPDPAGQMQLRDDIVDHINSPDNTDNYLKAFQGQIVKPSETQQMPVQQSIKQANTQAKQSLAKAQQAQQEQKPKQQQSTKPSGPIGSTQQTIGARQY
jgi:hypothetical protein